MSTDPLGLALPEGWFLQPAPDGGEPHTLTGWSDVGPWRVLIHCDIRMGWDGPTSIEVRFQTAELAAEATDTDGITTDVMRSVPLREARSVIKKYRPRILTALGYHAEEAVPERIKSDRDYALLAKEYIRLIEFGSRHPIAVMADLCDVSRNTMSARVRRAREMGLLEGEPRQPATRLTEKAKRLIEKRTD